MPSDPPASSPTRDDRRGLCATCRHAQDVEAAGGAHYVLCLHSKNDPAFPKYPRLPMISCSAYEQKAP